MQRDDRAGGVGQGAAGTGENAHSAAADDAGPKGGDAAPRAPDTIPMQSHEKNRLDPDLDVDERLGPVPRLAHEPLEQQRTNYYAHSASRQQPNHDPPVKKLPILIDGNDIPHDQERQEQSQGGVRV